jgi:hypothetical protein
MVEIWLSSPGRAHRKPEVLIEQHQSYIMKTLAMQ